MILLRKHNKVFRVRVGSDGTPVSLADRTGTCGGWSPVVRSDGIERYAQVQFDDDDIQMIHLVNPYLLFNEDGSSD